MRRKKHAGGTDRPKHGRPVHGEDPTGLNPHQIQGSVCDDRVKESLKPQSKEINGDRVGKLLQYITQQGLMQATFWRGIEIREGSKEWYRVGLN